MYYVFFLIVAPPPTADNGCDTKLFDLAKSVHWIVEDGQEGLSVSALKRKRKQLGLFGDKGDESEDEDMIGAPPVNDIYRARQQKRVK